MALRSYPAEIDQRNNGIHPHKFELWLFLLTVIMIFGGLTSAFIVQRGFLSQQQILYFDLPPVLFNNLLLIVASSVPMQYAVWVARRERIPEALAALGLTLLMGIVFLFGQWAAFGQMVASGLPFVDQARKDNSVSFFYVFTGLHGLHIVAALLAVASILYKTAFKRFRPARRPVAYELTATFWHFLGLLWVYLYLFLVFSQR
jgi:cytochrome c oxidase subunit 3